MTASPAPLLVLAIGNDQRGDDAAGPLLLARLAAAGIGDDGRVDLLGDYQLQVEHALDIAGRRAVLFVDAAWPGRHGVPAAGVRMEPIGPARDTTLTSHALSPRAVLQVAVDLGLTVPPAWQLAIEGDGFELGARPSPGLQRRLDEAEAAARRWLANA